MESIKKRIYDAATAVLGSVMITPKVAGDVFAKVRAEHFIASEYRAIFEAEQTLFLAGKSIDPVAVTALVGEDYRPMIMEIMDVTPTAANCMAYVDILIEQSYLYRLRELGAELQDADTLDNAQALIDRGARISADRGCMSSLTLAQGFQCFTARQGEDTHYLQFGIQGIDSRLYAEQGDYILLGARPSTGKTMLALQIAVYLSQTYRVGFYSLETRNDKLMDRIMTHMFSLNLSKIKKHALDSEDWTLIARQKQRLISSKLELIQATGRTAEDIASYARYRRHEVIFVDYIQLCRATQKTYSREQEVAAISTTLANFAREHKVTVIALAQLTREAEDSRAKTVRAPTLASFRESGSLEQDADIALLMYLSEPDNRGSDRILKIAKNKEGTVGKIHLAFDGDKQTFTERLKIPQYKAPEQPQAYAPTEWTDVTHDQTIINPEFGGMPYAKA